MAKVARFLMAIDTVHMIATNHLTLVAPRGDGYTVWAYDPKTITELIYFNTGRQGRQPMGAAAPLPFQHCQKVNDL